MKRVFLEGLIIGSAVFGFASLLAHATMQVHALIAYQVIAVIAMCLMVIVIGAIYNNFFNKELRFWHQIGRTIVFVAGGVTAPMVFLIAV